jgi:lysophospholipase L1-like esterase
MITTLLLLQPALIVPCFVVVCGGENDIGSGVPLRSSQVTFQSLLDLFYETNIELSSRSNHHHHGDTPSLYPSRAAVHLIFLGPKFEPWLQNDPASRRSYVQMSITFEQLCQQKKTDYIHYVDCLTMFCGNSKNQPGALYGGTAIPESIYFHSDQLHLSEAGYAKWKSILEDQISMILQDKVSKNATHDEHD